MMATRLILAVYLGLILVACGDPPVVSQTADVVASSNTPAAQAPRSVAVPVTDESARLNAWFDEKYEEGLQFSPSELTSLGRKERYDEIDDLSLAGAQKYADWFAATVQELQSRFNYELLDFETRTSYDLWIYTAGQVAENLRWHNQDYVFNQMNGAHVNLPTFLINYHTVDNEAEMQAYNSRVRGIGRAIGQALEQAQANAAFGVRPPRFSYESVITESGKLIAGQPFDQEATANSPLFDDGKSKIMTLLDTGAITQAQADALTLELRAALTEAFGPAYRELIAWFEADLPNADVQAKGVSSLPDGAAYYQQMLANRTTLSLTPEQVHATGLAEVARISREMQKLKEQMGFDGDMAALANFLRTDEQFYYPNTDEGRQMYLDDSSEYLARITEKLPEYFGILPKAPLVVKRVEAYREQDGAAQHYFSGSPDGSRPGTYYVHLSDTRSMPKTDMETTAYHEGLPGHHMQVSIAQELTGLPVFRTQSFYGAYVEGWALYAEQLAGEMGAFANPYMKFGQLNAEMWRAVRLVLDTGIHSMGWTEQEAVDYFAANVTLSLTAIASEVRRYITLPGQATSYKTGMMMILELRAKAQAQLGDDFDIREFHDIVLGGGALPLAILEKRVDNWLAGKN